MLIESSLPKSLWGYAILHANYIKNRMHTCSLLDKTPYEMVHSKKLNLQDTYEWGKDIYVKIKQDDKLANQATRAKWIKHSSQSDGHLIYWPSRQKVSVERNVIFDTGEKVNLSPTSPSDEPKVSTSKKPTIVPPIVPSVPSTPVRDSLSQPSGEGQIKDIIEPGPEQELEDLQPSQRPTIGPSEQTQPRRSKRIHLQQEKNLSSRPITRSQAIKDTGEYSSILAYEVNEDNHLETSEIILSQEKQEFNCDYLTISACAEPIEEKCIENVFSTQYLILPTNINEAL